MRLLTIVVAVMALLWSGWWVVGSRLVSRGAVAGIEAARAEGWDIAYDDLSVEGFPNRFDTTMDAPRVTSPDGAFGWSAPFVQILMLSYRPNRVIAVAPQEMVLDTPLGRIDIASTDLRGSAAVTASRSPDLLRATLQGKGLTLAGAGLDGEVATAQLALRRTGGEAAYDVALDVAAMMPGEVLRARIDPAGTLPATIDSLDLDVRATLDRVVGTGMEGTPRLTALDIRNLRLVWGEMRLSASGPLDVGPDGRLDGVVSVKVAGWETALRLAASLGLFPPERLPLVMAGMAGASGNDGSVAMDLTFADGQMRLGPIPLGPAPRL